MQIIAELVAVSLPRESVAGICSSGEPATLVFIDREGGRASDTTAECARPRRSRPCVSSRNVNGPRLDEQVRPELHVWIARDHLPARFLEDDSGGAGEGDAAMLGASDE